MKLLKAIIFILLAWNIFLLISSLAQLKEQKNPLKEGNLHHSQYLDRDSWRGEEN